jgi:nucleoside-diphosphate-sugar epimerase
MRAAGIDMARAYEGSDVVVTGGTGFVGRRLVSDLLGLGANVTLLVRVGDDDGRSLPAESPARVPVDLTDVAALTEALRTAKPSVIFHLATSYSVDNNVDLSQMIDVNVKAGAQLVAAASRLAVAPMIVNTGTCAEYGDLRGLADETAPINPNNAYASTKAAQTIVMRQLGRDLGVPLTTLRLYNLYGEWERASRIVPFVILSLLRGRTVELTAGEQAKDYTYVGDLPGAFLSAGVSPAAAGEIINIGSGRTVTIRALVEEIMKHFPGSEDIVRFGAKPYREDEMWLQATHTGKAERLLEWRAETSLEEGIARAVAWYRGASGDYYAGF